MNALTGLVIWLALSSPALVGFSRQRTWAKTSPAPRSRLITFAGID